jgi:hypothetical protein
LPATMQCSLPSPRLERRRSARSRFVIPITRAGWEPMSNWRRRQAWSASSWRGAVGRPVRWHSTQAVDKPAGDRRPFRRSVSLCPGHQHQHGAGGEGPRLPAPPAATPCRMAYRSSRRSHAGSRRVVWRSGRRFASVRRHLRA